MSAKKHLFIGYGKLAARCGQRLVSQGHQVVGVARTARPAGKNITMLQGDIKSPSLLSQLAQQSFDTATIILTPSVYSESGYDDTYVQSLKALNTVWGNAGAPERIIFISSTSVYGQHSGERVNEELTSEPIKPTARKLREAEIFLLDAFAQAQIIRFSGIYGPGRDYLLRQVWDQKAGDESYTNRIHEDDCCGVICHLLLSDNARHHRVLLASDCEPVKGSVIRQWLAAQMGGIELTIPPQGSGRVGNKRCDNRLLLESGYQFVYPSYREGYPPLIKAFLEGKAADNV